LIGFPVESYAGWVFIDDKTYSSYQVGGLNVLTNTWDTLPLNAGLAGGSYVSAGVVSSLDATIPYPSLTGFQVQTAVNNGLVTQSSNFVINEPAVIAGIQSVLPFFMAALLSGFVAAFAPAYLLKFLRGILKSN